MSKRESMARGPQRATRSWNYLAKEAMPLCGYAKILRMENKWLLSNFQETTVVV